MTRTLKAALPRSATVSEGISVDQLSLSATTMRSALSTSACSSRKRLKEREPCSSSPSMNSAMPTSGSATSAIARTAAMCVMTPALSSEAPRP